MQLGNHDAIQSGTNNGGGKAGTQGGKLDDALRTMGFEDGVAALTPREQSRRRLVQLPPGEFVLDRVSPTAWVDVVSRPTPTDEQVDDAPEHERLQGEGLIIARDRLRETTARIAGASANGLPSAAALDAGYDQALATSARPDLGLTRGAPVEWLVKEQGPWSAIDVNPTASPNLHAEVHGMHVDLAVTMSGKIQRFASGGQPPDAQMDLQGLADTIELGLVAGVAPQVEEGKDASSLDHTAIRRSLDVRARPSLQRYGYQFVPTHISLLDGAKKYTAPASELVQEGMAGNDTNLTVVASADANETAKETRARAAS